MTTTARRLVRDAIDVPRRVRAAVRGLPTILSYHRVADVEHDPWELAVSASHFEDHLHALVASGRPCLTLAELHRRVLDGTVPHGAVAVTLDDGYLDNLTTAMPLLEQAGVPATVFVITGTLGGTTWWDELAARVPERASLDALWDRLQPATEAERRAAIDTLPAAPMAVDRLLTADEVVALDRSPVIDVAAHTVSHPLLPTLSPQEQLRELVECKRTLEALLGRPVTHLAYPHGAADHVTRAAAEEAGYRLAVTTTAGHVTPAADPLALPRITVRDGSGRDLRRTLRNLG